MRLITKSAPLVQHATCDPLRNVRYPIKTANPPPKQAKQSCGSVHCVPKLRPSKLQSIIDSLHIGGMVIVSAEYAKYFNPAPQDGRTYIVQDPIRPWVDHVTRPDGTYVLLDKKKLSKSPPSAFVGEIEVHTKYQNSKHKKKAARLASKLTADTLVECQQDTPPLICLIDINRVMRICGFKKSFIYEQADFPTPVRLGVSQRSSVRWIESEIFAWVQNLANKREIPT